MGGINITDDFDEAWKDVEQFVGSIQDKIADEGAIKRCLKEIGQEIQKNVRRFAPRRSQKPSYSDAGKNQYAHIMDDITYNVKKSKASKQYYVSVHGKKWTGYKWLWVNDGHVMKDGTWVSGNHFVDKAEAASSDAVNTIVDKYIKDALEGK